MTDTPAALQADFTSYKPVPSRKVLQLVFEVPLETQEQTFKTLGYPTPGESTWVGIARLNLKPAQVEGATAPNPKKPKTRSQVAAIKLQSEDFQIWLAEEYPKQWDGFYIDQHMISSEAADAVFKTVLGIESKTELDADAVKAARFDAMLADYSVKDIRR